MFLLVALLVVIMGLEGKEQGYAFQSTIATASTLRGEVAHSNKAHNNNLTMLSVAVGHIGQFCHGTQFFQQQFGLDDKACHKIGQVGSPSSSME
jgi:hypothetical protein